MAMPGFDYEAPEHPPVRSWLYDAATVIPVTGTGGATRVLEGARVWPRNCGASGTWPSDPCGAGVLNEQQTVTLTGATTGNFVLSFAGQDTAPIAYNATIAAVEAAIEALPNVGAVTVTGAPGAWVVEFIDPAGNVPLMTIDTTGTDGTGNVAVTQAATTKGGDRPGPSDLFDPITVWAWDECGSNEDENDVARRALHILDLKEAAYVESAFATRLVADAGAPVSSVVGARSATALLAQAMHCDGVRGVIHADMPKVSELHAGFSVNDSGALTFRPFGNPIATGCYQPLGDLIIGTGPVFIWRGEATVRFEWDYVHNLKMALAERTVLVAYEPCFIAAYEGTPIPIGGGGGGGGLVYPAP